MAPNKPIQHPQKLSEMLQSIIKSKQLDFIDTEIFVDNIYIIGSRGCPTGDVTQNSDLDLFIVIDNQNLSEEELKKVSNHLATELLWNHIEDILEVTDLALEPTKQSVDFLVYPKSLESYELNSYMEHGGYQNVYSIMDDSYMY